VTDPQQVPPPGSPYGAGYPAPYGAAPMRTNVMSIISLVAGLCGFTVLPLLGSIAAVITGHMALAEIRRTGEEGTTFAKVGLWLGYIAIGLTVLALAGFLLFLVVGAAALSTSG